ncbi:MAG: HAD hydrolase-like protein [Desulfobulbaceae bacterium]|nr:HAD hydrolase-like protein [Desulfobulbaceae bacterium]
MNKISPDFSWDDVDTVLLDMDGTLLDKHFDDYFWETYVPEHYSLVHDISIQRAKEELLATYKKVESTLVWTDLDYWSRELGLDIPELKIRVNNLIDVHPYVVDFLRYVKEIGKSLFLVTNAHSKTLDIKLRKTAIGKWFDKTICAEEVGLPKEDPEFWQGLQRFIPYDAKRTMLAEDTERILVSAEKAGLRPLIYVARPSSRAPIRYSEKFPSIVYFNELIRK